MNLKKQQQIQQTQFHRIGHTDHFDLSGHRQDPVCLDDAFSMPNSSNQGKLNRS